jgi:hypothetical protein
MDGLYSLTSMSVDITSCCHTGSWLLKVSREQLLDYWMNICGNYSLEHHYMFHNWGIVTLMINNCSAGTETTMEPHALVSKL